MVVRAKFVRYSEMHHGDTVMNDAKYSTFIGYADV